MERTRYFKQFIGNKSPCGGFYQMGGAVKKNKYIENEKYYSMVAKIFGYQYLRCIAMNYEDYLTIETDISNGIYKEYYNIRFFPIDFLDYLQITRGLKDANEYLENLGKDEQDKLDLCNLIKTFIPKMFNGKPMDRYDVIDLYVNNLGLKCVPSSDNEWIINNKFPIFAYYEAPESDTLDAFVDKSTMIYTINDTLGDLDAGIEIDEVHGSIDFIGEQQEGYGKYKNIVRISQP